jgi:chromosome segregation ATPase
MPKLVFKLSDSQSLDFPLAGERVRLGRNASNDIVIDNSWISSFHAEFLMAPDGTAEVRDLDSSNGTTVNGERIQKASLKPGDTVGFGQLEATFDPLPEGVTGPGGIVAPREAKPLKGPLPVKLPPPAGVLPATTPVTSARSSITEPIPAAKLTNRGVAPTMPVPVRDDTDARREVQQVQAEVAALRGESKALTEKVDGLRREREGEEQSQAQLRLQGEREARELRGRLDQLRLEVEKTESAAADGARERVAALKAQEEELHGRVTSLESAAFKWTAEVRSKEERLAALQDDESRLAGVSSLMQVALKEADEVATRRDSSLAELAEVETKTTVALAELAKQEALLSAARTEQLGVESAAAAAVANLQQVQARVTAAGESLQAREAELAALLLKLENVQKDAEAGAGRILENEQAVTAAAARLENLGNEAATLTEKRDRLAAEINAAEATAAEQQAQLKAAGVRLLELENAQTRLAEMEAAITVAEAKSKTADEAARAAEIQRTGLASEIEAAEQKQRALEGDLAALTAEITSLTAQKSAAAAEIAAIRATGEQELTALRAAAENEIAVRRGTAESELDEISSKVSDRKSAAQKAASEIAILEKSLADATTRLTAAQSEAEAVEEAMRKNQSLLTDGEKEAADITARLAQMHSDLASSQTATAKASREVEAQKAILSTLAGEITVLTGQRSAATDSLAKATAELQSVQQQITAARAEAERADALRADCAALQTRAADLQAKATALETRLNHLEERRRTYSDAPDANWGTVHAITKGIIKQVDLLDDLINHLVQSNGSRETIEQWNIFRSGLTDILAEYCVTPFTYESGFVVDVPARKRIQIVENQSDSGDGTRIEKTWRPGYVCSNGPVGVQTLLRKAEVSVLIGR